MSRQALVWLSDDDWRVADLSASGDGVKLECPAEAPLPERAAGLARHLEAHGLAGQPVVLAVPSAWCLCASVSTEGLERSSRKNELAFRLEEQLPVSAEDVVADYIWGQGGLALGVCVPTQKLSAIIAACESAGLGVGGICPAALLTAGWAAHADPDLDAVLAGVEGPGGVVQYDLVELQAGGPVKWWWLAEDESAVWRHVDAMVVSDRPMRLAAVGCPAALRERVRADARITLTAHDGVDSIQAASAQMARILQAGQKPWVDLRTGALAVSGGARRTGPALGALVASVALLLACVGGVMLWRGRQYESLGERFVREQAAVYRQAMPGQPVPGRIKGRLQSERQKLAGLGGQGLESGGQASASTAGSALVGLRDILKSLPADGRCRILEISIQSGLLRVDGQAQAHGDAEALTSALRASGVYDVEPPKTQSLREGGVSFTFTASAKGGVAQEETP